MGLRKPEFRQDEDFMVTLWRKDGSGTVQSDPERSKSDPNIVEQVYQLIVKDHSISRARISELGVIIYSKLSQSKVITEAALRSGILLIGDR